MLSPKHMQIQGMLVELRRCVCVGVGWGGIKYNKIIIGEKVGWSGGVRGVGVGRVQVDDANAVSFPETLG